MSANPSLLLLASGARLRYVEDIVRALALPSGGQIQFRYEDKLVAPGVRTYSELDGLAKHKCYLAYLDNRTPGRVEIVPVREAVVLEVKKRGSAFIFTMEVARYIRTYEFSQLRSVLAQSVQDQLPVWQPEDRRDPVHPFDGYWVNFLSSPLNDSLLMNHDVIGQKHLDLFEHAVKILCEHATDFGEPASRLFFNVIGMKDSSGSVVPLVAGSWKLLPGKNYQLEIYHFYPEEGTHADRPIHWLCCRASGEGVHVLGSRILRADSEYDSKKIDLQTVPAVRKSANVLTIFTSMEPDDDKAFRADLSFGVEVSADHVRNSLQAVVIGVFVSLPAWIAIYPNLPSWRGLVILFGGLLAGIASVFRFSKSP